MAVVDPNPPDDVCKCYDGLPILELPFAEILGPPASRPQPTVGLQSVSGG